jgi:class 3 adenylate cyclase
LASLLYNAPEGVRRHPIGERCTIGRSTECDLVLADTSISRRHASIVKINNGYRLDDDGGRFGSFINGEPVKGSAFLKHGDEVRLGSVAMRFDATSAADEAHPEPAVGAGTDPAELRARISALEKTQRQSTALLQLHQLFFKCTSAAMIAQSVGPDLMAALRADRCLIALAEGPSGQLQIRFSRELTQLPAEREEELARAFARFSTTGAVELPPDVSGRSAVLACLQGRGGTSLGAIYAELPPHRRAGADELELFNAMCDLITTAVANLMLQQQIRREEQARANLSRYLSDQVAEAVLSGALDLKLGGEQRLVTVLFFDVRGFTSMVEKLPPEHVLAILNDCFAEAVPIVKAAQGTVDKFIGDSLMAVFGAPNALEDQALRAVNAAREIRRAVLTLRERWLVSPWAQQIDVTKFAVGLGVNTGFAVAGNLGTEERKEYAVIGDPVNVASRLCANAKPGQILIGPQTAAQVQGQVRLTELGPLKVKGRDALVPAFEVHD